MPIVNVQGVGRVNFPETMSHEAIIRAIENEILQQKPPTPEPIETSPAAPPSTDRTWGEALKDVALSLPSGGGQIMQLPAQVARLAGADVTPDSFLGGIEARGKRAQDIVQEMRSPGYKTQAAGVQQRIAETGPEGGVMGAIKKAPMAMYEYLSSPTMMSVFLTEQIPQLALTGGVGKGAQALRMLFGDVAKLTVEEAAKVALKTGVRAEIASGAVLQGMDIGSDTYKEVHDYLIAQGKTEPEAHEIALEKGRTAAAGAAVASLVAQNLPGARKAQEALLGGSVGKNAWRGAAGTGLGESYSEGIEEGAGAVIKGQLAAQVNPQRDPYAGSGEATGMGAAAGFGIGAPLGAISGGANAAQQTAITPPAITPPVVASPAVTPAATDISKSGLQTAEGREAGRMASHLTAEEQGDEEVLAAVQLGKEIYEANPNITRAEFVTQLRDQTGFSDKKLANIIKEVGRPRRRKKAEAEVTDEVETDADLQSQLAVGQAEITDEDETEADLQNQLEEEEKSKLGQGATQQDAVGLNQPFVDAGRVMAITEINGVRVPFYISTGSGGKASVPAGKWYPFFGVGSDGWLNKGSEEEINDFYGSAALKAKAEELNNLHGDIRERQFDNTLPVAWDGKASRNQWNTYVRADVNAGLNPVPNIGRAGAWSNNVNSLLARINKAPAAPAAPTTDNIVRDKRVVEADILRTTAEQQKRSRLLGNDVELAAYAKDKGISIEEMRKLLENNFITNEIYLKKYQEEIKTAPSANTADIKFTDSTSSPNKTPAAKTDGKVTKDSEGMWHYDDADETAKGVGGEYGTTFKDPSKHLGVSSVYIARNEIHLYDPNKKRIEISFRDHKTFVYVYPNYDKDRAASVGFFENIKNIKADPKYHGLDGMEEYGIPPKLAEAIRKTAAQITKDADSGKESASFDAYAIPFLYDTLGAKGLREIKKANSIDSINYQINAGYSPESITEATNIHKKTFGESADEDNNKSTGTGGTTTGAAASIRKKAAKNTSVEPANGVGVGDIGEAAGFADVGTGSQQSALNKNLGDTLEKTKTGTEVVEGENADLNTVLTDLANSVTAVKLRKDNKILDKTVLERHLSHVIDAAERITSTGYEAEQRAAQRALKYLGYNAEHPLYKEIVERLTKIKNVISEQQSNKGEAKQLYARINVLKNTKATLASELKYIRTANRQLAAPDINNINELHKLIAENDASLREANNAKRALEREAKKTSYIDEAAVVRSQVRGSGPALLFDRVVALVDSIKSRWAGSPKVHTVPTFLALPPHLQEFLIKHKALDAPGIYDTKSKEVFIIADKLASEADVYLTVIHEVVGHHGLRTVLGSKYDGFMKLAYFNPEIKALADRNMEENKKLSKAIAVEEALAEKSESNILNTPATRQLLDKLVSLIRTGLRAITGGRVAAKFSDAEVRNIINASYRAIKDGTASSVSAVTAEDPPAAMSPVRTSTAGAAPMPTIDDMVKANTNTLNAKLTKNSPWKWAKFMASPEGWHWLTFKFENTRVYAKNVENILRLQGTLTFTKKGFNALYSALITAGAKAQDIIRTRLGKHEIALDESVKAYAAAKGIDYEKALATLDLYSKAWHEPERRHIFFLLHSPLLNDRTGKTVSHPSVLSNTVLTPADMRVEVMKIFVNANGGLNASDITTYSNILEDLAKNYVVKDGYSPTNNKATDENSQDYAPIAEWDVARVAVINNAREADAITHGSLLDNYFDAMKSLQEATKEVNKESYHWTPQVDNFVNLYKAFNNGAGWQHYVPYKGHMDVGNKNALIDPRSTRMSSEYKDVEMPMSGGKENDSENVILQALVDSAKSAWLLGSSDVPLAIKNNIDSPTKDIAGKLVAVSTFADRHLNPLDIAKYKGEKAFFHRLPNGDIEIYTVVNDNLRESIRQSYTPPQYIMQQINTVTSIVGQFHTRFNLSFAPSNYVRDSLTNASTVALEAHGPKVAAQYLASVSGKVLDGGMIKIGNLMRLYDQGRISEIEALAIKDKTGLLTDALEYLKSGGRVAQRMSYNTDSQLKQLVRPHGRNFVFKTQDGILKWIDVWNDSFEMTNRVAMYSVLKADITAKNIAKNMNAADAKEAAIAEASSIAKNLANFETVGEWGRSAGALYMYFRAAATGAFRAFDALSPAWTSAQTKVNQMSEEAKNDLKLVAEVEKNFKKLQIRSRVGIAALSATGAALYTMAYLASDDDEMGRNKVATDDMSRWTRYLRLPMSIFTDSPGYKDKFVQAPWGFGPSAFMAIGAQTAAMVSGNMKFSDYAGNFIQIGMDSFMPIPISRISPTESPSNFIIDSIAPSLARPFIEFNSNMNALGAPIYNDRQYRYGGAYTGGDSIPEIYKDVAKMFFDMSDGDINISPNSVYFFASNFADGAMQIASAGRNIYLTSKGEKDFDIKSDTLLLNSFVGKASNYDARQYDAVKKQIEGMKGRLDMLKDKPEQLAQYISAHPLEPMIVDIYQKQINGLLKTVQTQANTIRSATYFTPKDKKDILEPLTSSQNYIKRGLIDTFEAFDIKP